MALPALLRDLARQLGLVSPQCDAAPSGKTLILLLGDCSVCPVSSTARWRVRPGTSDAHIRFVHQHHPPQGRCPPPDLRRKQRPKRVPPVHDGGRGEVHPARRSQVPHIAGREAKGGVPRAYQRTAITIVPHSRKSWLRIRDARTGVTPSKVTTSSRPTSGTVSSVSGGNSASSSPQASSNAWRTGAARSSGFRDRAPSTVATRTSSC